MAHTAASIPRGFFITGTDTGVGKTWITLGLMHGLQARGLAVTGMKPVAAGCVPGPDGLRNDDAQQIQAQSSLLLPYETVNPYAFAPAIAPHLAAAEAGIHIDFARIQQAYRELAERVDCVVVEGVGGWKVPLNEADTVADMAKTLGLPVILVVGIRLGCLNHALLTAESIRARGCTLAAWVANQVDAGCERVQENIEALRERIPVPFLGMVPRLHRFNAAAVAERLALERLFQI